MAKIEMDLTEYEAMKKVEKLLQDSLDKERKLQEEVDRLNKEKIEALENARMKVVKVTKTEITEHLLIKRRSYANNYDLYDILRQLEKSPYREPDYERLIEFFFEKTTSRSFPTEETTVHGLDQIKMEMRQEYEKGIGEADKKKLADYDEIVRKFGVASQENIRLKSDNHNLDQAAKKAVDEAVNYKNLFETARATSSKKMKDIFYLISNSVIIFGKKTLLKKFNTIVNEK